MNRNLLLLALLALCVYFHRETITSFPAHIHAWTQSDRYALSLRFAEHSSLFFPRTYNLATENGITAVDLPLHDWVAGIYMRILGTDQPWVFRVWTLLLSLTGTYFLFRLAARQTGSEGRGAVVALWTFTLPIVVYYQDGFLPSAAGFALLLIAYERYFTYKADQKPVQFVQAVLFFTLAALPRSPMVMFLVCVVLQELLSRRFKREHLALLPAFVLLGAWAWYKNHLSVEYGSQFLTQFTPAGSVSEFWTLTLSVCKRWLLQLFTWPHYILLVAVLPVAAWKHFWRDAQTRILLVQSGLAFAASAAFYVVLVRQFVDHEYYFLDSFYLPVVLLFLAAMRAWPISKDRFSGLLVAGCAVLLIAGAVFSKKVQEAKHREEPWDLGELTRKNFEGSGDWLDSLQVPRDARILVIDAFTTNIPLIHMRREGWTVLTTNQENIQKALELPFDFVVLQDFSAASDVLYPYPEITGKIDRVAGNGKLTLCQRSKSNEYAFLGIAPDATAYIQDFENTDSTGNWGTFLQDSGRVATGRFSARVKSDNEFGPSLFLENLPASAKRVYFEGNFFTDSVGTPLQMDLTLDHNGERLYYRGQPFKAKVGGQWFRFQVMFLLPKHPDGTSLKIYSWNKEKGDWRIDDVKVYIY